MISYAQNFEDVMLARLFEGEREGFYVDIGASHPVELSVTKHFYDLGWRGINVEPVARNIALFERLRPGDVNLNVAVGAAAGEMPFHEVEDFDALSTFDAAHAEEMRGLGYRIRTYPVPVVTADSLFEAHGLDARRVDFLKIDVEGHEPEVLKALDLRRFRPRVLVIESIVSARPFAGWANFDSYVSNHERWEPAVLAAGYEFAHFDGISRFYLCDDQRHLAPRLRVPPGIYDGIVFAREEAQREALEAQVEGARAAARAADEAARAALEAERRAHAAELAERIAAEAALASRLAAEQQARQGVEAALAFERAKGVRARLRDLRAQVRESAKRYFLAGLLRLASGPPPRPLPRVSLVVPVFNGAAHIGETLESVLRQDYPELEVIVVDGASTDGTLDVVRAFESRADLRHRVARVISEPDRGMYDAIGKGFDAATGEVLCYLNADDQLEGEALAAVGRWFADHPRADVVYHEDTVLVDGWKFPNVRQPRRVGVVDLLNRHILFQDGVFFRARAYRAVGGVRRDLRLAGDYDLWLRMSARFPFHRRAGHMSCFRIRPGQLSADMGRYHEELERARADFLAAAPPSRRALWRATAAARRAWRLVQARRVRERLFFPIDFGNLPPPRGIVPDAPGAFARSPVDSRAAERLLFSAMDTRFGERDLHHIYLDSRHGIAITHPPIDAARLDALYRKHYSTPPTAMVLPEGTSPYRQWNRMPWWERALLELPFEMLRPLFLRAWDDNTLAELRKVLRGAGIDGARGLRVLDAGCFEGHLLDRIAKDTPWQAAGLEPNANAVGIARGKGHEVWQGRADEALDLVPPDRHFDVVFMGQSIEHVDDPVGVLRALAMLLAPGGVLVASTPNLDSRQIDWFGPTWAHWHPPYHRYIFSGRGMAAVARQAGLVPLHYRTFSHPYWTAMSVAQNWVGLGGSVSHAVPFDRSIGLRASRLDTWSKLFWNALGKGDYSFIVMGTPRD